MPRNNHIIQKTVRAAGWILVALAFAYIAVKIHRTPSGAFAEMLGAWVVIIAVLLGFAYSFLNVALACAWAIFAHTVSERSTRLRSLIALHLKTGIIKYLPGNIFHFAGRHLFADETGIAQRSIFVSNVMEISAVLSALGFFYAIVSPGDIAPSGSIPISRWMAILAGGAALAGGIGASSIIKGDKYFFRKIIPAALLSLGLYVLFFAGTSLLFFILGSSIVPHPVAMREFRAIAGFFCAAWASGFLVPGAPGGFGVREGVLIALLAPFWGDGGAISSAILFRVITIAGDALAFFWGLLIARGKSMQQ